MFKATGSGRLREVLEELEQSGSPVDLSVADREPQFEKLEIEQVGGYHDSAIVELQDGRWALRANLAVTNQTSKPIDVVHVELRTPWDYKRFEWLTPLEVKSQARGKRARNDCVYKFPGSCGLELPYDEVINRYLIERHQLSQMLGGGLAVGNRRPDAVGVVARATHHIDARDHWSGSDGIFDRDRSLDRSA